MADTASAGTWFLLDGHLRLEALKELGITEVECLLATDDDTYTYNKRVNRIPPIQEHRMIVRAMERGVSATEIAEALNLEVQSVLRRFRLLEGISPEAAEMLKDTPCSMKVFDILRQMSAVRQIEAADLMIGQNNFSIMFARAIRAATPENQLVAARKGRGAGIPTPSGQQIARMERELAALQTVNGGAKVGRGGGVKSGQLGGAPWRARWPHSWREPWRTGPLGPIVGRYFMVISAVYGLCCWRGDSFRRSSR